MAVLKRPAIGRRGRVERADDKAGLLIWVPLPDYFKGIEVCAWRGGTCNSLHSWQI